MTNDYKENLLDYLTGNIEPTAQTTTPYYLEHESVASDSLSEFLRQRYNGIFELKGSVQCKDGTGKYNGKILYWGSGYVNQSDDEEETFLLLVDDKLNPISLITSYASGSRLFEIATLEVAEDGNIYGIDYVWEESGQCKFRIVLFNNISEIPNGYSTYTCLLRNSYYIPGYDVDDDLNPNQQVFIKKSPQSAKYYYAIAESTGVDYFPGTFTINVGSANEWIKYPEILFNSSGKKEAFIFFDDEDTVNTRYYIVEDGEESKQLTVATTNGENNPNYNTLVENLYPYFSNSQYDYEVYFSDMKVKENGDIYIVLYGINQVSSNTWEQLFKVYLYDGNMKLLLTKRSNISNTETNYPDVYTMLNGNNLFLYMYIQENVADIDSDNEIWFAMVNDKNDIQTLQNTGYKKKTTTYAAFDNVISLTNAFNLYNYILYYYSGTGYNLLTTKLIYNEENYNGSTYNDYNSLIGKQGILLDDNNKPIYARNLYNYKAYNNRTISVLNVPNNMLNDINISKESLLGETNTTLVDNTQSITKNIYEELFINFFSTLKMRNENESIYVDNKEGAIRLNQSVSNKLDYDNAKATKIRKNYSDGTNYTTPTIATINNGVATYEIYLQAPEDKGIISIDILSEDEETLYTSIKNLTLTPGAYYKISQDVHIE